MASWTVTIEPSRRLPPAVRAAVGLDTWDDAEVVVVRDAAGAIVAASGYVRCRLIHGLWVDPRHRRRPDLAWALWRALRGTAEEVSLTQVPHGSRWEHWLARVGAVRLPGASWAWRARR